MTQSFFKRKLFDASANDDLSERRILGGQTTNINNFNEIKYRWTAPLYRRMVSNYWIPEIISLDSDRVQYRNVLSHEEKEGFNETLSFLIFLDSIQATALPSFGDYITAPEASRIMVLQAFQEVVHSQAYSYILESICDPQEIHGIYYRFKDNEELLKRCSQMTDLYSLFRNNPNDENLAMMFLASLLLEGILFFNGFYFFYSLAYNERMTKCADEIRLINRKHFYCGYKISFNCWKLLLKYTILQHNS